MELGSLITNTKAMTEGVWMDYLGDAKLLIARMDNPRYRAFIQGNRFKAISVKEDEDTETVEESDLTGDVMDLMTEAMSQTVLLGWENIEVSGERIDYSPETALRLLRGLPKFRDDVVMLASTAKRFADDEFQEALDTLRPS